ncbi:MAG: HEAT repeat domain-containing protein [Kofleriaceae bacterium]
MSNLSFDDRLRAVVERVTPDGRESTEALIAKLVHAGATSDEALERLVRDRTVPSDLRGSGCWLLSRLGSKGARDVFLELLADPEERIREDAAMSLSLVTSAADSVAIAALIDKVRHDAAKSVRIAGMFTLGMMNVSAAASVMLALLADLVEDDELRADAAEAMAHMTDDLIFDALFAALDDTSPLVRYSAAYALGEQGDSRAIAKLTDLAADQAMTPWGTVSSSAESALEQLAARED